VSADIDVRSVLKMRSSRISEGIRITPPNATAISMSTRMFGGEALLKIVSSGRTRYGYWAKPQPITMSPTWAAAAMRARG